MPSRKSGEQPARRGSSRAKWTCYSRDEPCGRWKRHDADLASVTAVGFIEETTKSEKIIKEGASPRRRVRRVVLQERDRGSREHG
mmetsp:Transcript_21157/g.43361  ORF Transcript_21157/g.43361 Transcript_21157/m.43361 type:complete len:85 (+) Transcript_21157:82-336(+)